MPWLLLLVSYLLLTVHLPQFAEETAFCLIYVIIDQLLDFMDFFMRRRNVNQVFVLKSYIKKERNWDMEDDKRNKVYGLRNVTHASISYKIPV